MLQLCYKFGADLHGVAESRTQTTERAHDDAVRSPVGEGRSREHHHEGRGARLDGIDDAGQFPEVGGRFLDFPLAHLHFDGRRIAILPNLAGFHFRIWLCFTSRFGDRGGQT